ncbi:hypothetical protein IMW75_02760 [Pseudomonas gregormendelii]|uniref:Uncharacterized protein n=1 Tax=Pseudomonas gregormendelii TaxID=1628277 RepID=A0ABS3ADA8_9PSED|nr:hypothetical protein [Pseudomonas gregormendelii]MBN3964209.1 hypothetical protein [Pseudomonas gregormendelii]
MEKLIIGGNEPTSYTARPVRDIESARPPQASNGSRTSVKRVVKLLITVVGGVALAASGIASAMTRRPDAFDLQSRPVANRLTMSPEHQSMIESIPFGNETALLDNFIDAPQRGLAEFLGYLTIGGMDAKVVARGGEIKEKFPRMFNCLEESRRHVVHVLDVFEESCEQPCSPPLPTAGEFNATQMLKDYIGYMMEDLKKKPKQVEKVYGNLLSERGQSPEALDRVPSHIAPYTGLIEFLRALAENPCHARDAGDSARQCLDFFLVEQTPEGIQNDQADNRPPTYAATAHPIMTLIESKLPIYFTKEVFNLTSYPTLLTHIMLHEMIHYAGYIDLLYAGVDVAIMALPPEQQEEAYRKKHKELRKDIRYKINDAPDSMKIRLVEFYDKQVGKNPGMTSFDKLEDLAKVLKSDNKVWKVFGDQTTDIIAMRFMIPSMQRNADLINGIFYSVGF